MNERIRAKEIRLIDEQGTQVGVVSLEEGLKLAKDKDLDLLMVSDATMPPVCKIIDYGQFKYEQHKREKLARKSVKSQVIKELKLSSKISPNDYNVRLTLGKKFLGKGYKLKISLLFKGREIEHIELGKKVINNFLKDIQEYGKPANDLSKSGRMLSVVISPK